MSKKTTMNLKNNHNFDKIKKLSTILNKLYITLKNTKYNTGKTWNIKNICFLCLSTIFLNFCKIIIKDIFFFLFFKSTAYGQI